MNAEQTRERLIASGNFSPGISSICPGTGIDRDHAGRNWNIQAGYSPSFQRAGSLKELRMRPYIKVYAAFAPFMDRFQSIVDFLKDNICPEYRMPVIPFRN